MQTAIRRLWIQLTADRRRFGVLCLTLAVGLLLWARLVIVSNVSRTAMAGDKNTEAGVGVKSPTQAGTGSGKADKSKAVAKGAGGEVVELRLWSRSERDPFVISPDWFPRPQSRADVKQEAGKLPTEPAEDSTQKEARMVARLREALGSVRLEAAMENSMAVINGKRYRAGDRLPALGNERFEFVLAEVRQRSVVLECEGRRFEVAMSIPGLPGN